jgi:hypothetical protein
MLPATFTATKRRQRDKASWCPSACDADPGNIAAYPPADITVERIGDLVSADPATLLGNAVADRAQQEES